MARNGNGNGDSGGTSSPNPKGRVQADDCSGGVSFNANLANFSNDPPVLNESPATKKSYSWNSNKQSSNAK
jgi:hypothetical protein